MGTAILGVLIFKSSRNAPGGETHARAENMSHVFALTAPCLTLARWGISVRPPSTASRVGLLWADRLEIDRAFSRRSYVDDVYTTPFTQVAPLMRASLEIDEKLTHQRSK